MRNGSTNEPVEILVDERRRQSGLIIRMDRLADDEVTTVADLPVTTTARTAFDLGRIRNGPLLSPGWTR